MVEVLEASRRCRPINDLTTLAVWGARLPGGVLNSQLKVSEAGSHVVGLPGTGGKDEKV